MLRLALLLILIIFISGCHRASETILEARPRAAAIEDPTAPMDDASAAVTAARNYARAIAAGDLVAAKSFLFTPTRLHQRLADVVNRYFLAAHHVRVAAMQGLGESEGKRLPMNDSGTFFIDRMTARLNGDSGEVVWKDNFGTGSERTIDVIRVNGRWLLSMNESGGDSKATRELIDEIGQANRSARKLEQLAARIKSGELKTFDEINHHQ